jgi:hypothetical protein
MHSLQPALRGVSSSRRWADDLSWIFGSTGRLLSMKLEAQVEAQDMGLDIIDATRGQVGRSSIATCITRADLRKVHIHSSSTGHVV